MRRRRKKQKRKVSKRKLVFSGCSETHHFSRAIALGYWKPLAKHTFVNCSESCFGFEPNSTEENILILRFALCFVYLQAIARGKHCVSEHPKSSFPLLFLLLFFSSFSSSSFLCFLFLFVFVLVLVFVFVFFFSFACFQAKFLPSSSQVLRKI